MAFTWFADKPLRTREQIAREVHTVSLRRGLDELATVIALMTISVEAGANDKQGNRQWWCPWNERVPATKGYPYDSKSDDNRSSGYFQQQPGPRGEPWWGTPEQMMTLPLAADTFLSRLANDYGRAKDNPQLAGEFAQRVQGSSFPDRYREKWDEAWTVLRRALANQPAPEVNPMPVSGDPVWLEDVLRPALGDRLRTLPGWKDSGVGGTMGQIWGMVWHHTGSAGATAQSIRDGRPDLPGPLSQLHIAQDGTVTIVAVGPCNHAGKGSWSGLPTDNANDRTIGIECAYPKDVNNQAEKWPDAQIIAMRDTAAALTKHLGVPVSHNISHKEWAQLGPAGFRQGKTDPWNLDMNWFRSEVQKDMDGFVFPGEHGPIVTPPPVKRFPEDWTDRELMIEILRQQRGPELKGWPQLGNRSEVDALGAIGEKLGIPGFDDRGI